MRDLMPLLLLGLYLVLLAVQIVLLVRTMRKHRHRLWLRLMAFESICAVLAAMIGMCYDLLPGYGFMPGLSYLGEVLFSFGAAAAYGMMLAITLVAGLIRKNWKK